ncbi:ATP-grasp domain-containing protein [Acetatifactor muris]|jgi:carbamoylphosphate synthase large subunit|uniref:D-alanine--D-alanine ligase n=1 Tax=Acetatifactor muris TaxID=879566 RepID=A0A2K4ZD24_9FIRM|nr:ATP-grasp domain-containing protein [Acetatifactor muris]MCR2046764.1 ATP-grasp domain-containing protein [Acetatifactor muris]SOY28358.1 D-alanine--D-alanine ligase [Acetatifactor muris]
MENEVIGLIAGISGEILTEKLHKKGKRVALIEGKPGESGEETADFVCRADLRQVDKIDSFFKEMGVKKVVIGTGHILALELSRDLDERGYLLSNDPAASLLAKDKIRYKEALMAQGINTPKFIRISPREEMPDTQKIIDYLGLPCVVKSPVDKVLPQKANNVDELDAAILEILGKDSTVLVEEFVRGVDVTVPVLVKKTGAEAIIVSYYSKAQECHLKGFTSNDSRRESLTPEMETEVKKYCEQVALKTGMKGLCRIDAMVVPDNMSCCIYILEANSVMVTGIHENQMEYGRFFLEREGVDFADILIETTMDKFEDYR